MQCFLLLLVLASVVPCQNIVEKAQHHENPKINQTKQLPAVGGCCEPHRTFPLRFCMSCPNLGSETRTKTRQPMRDYSPLALPVSCDFNHPYKNSSALPFNTSYSPCLLHPSLTQITSKRSYSKTGEGCPCPKPCGPCGCPCGCNCLPPPCNQPPKCVQYMTGYYYYPYGYWFCGPYHVSGTCTPVGPCAPPPSPLKCAPACVCPAATAMVDAQSPTASKEDPKATTFPNTEINFPLRDATQQTRSGMAKFFPFNTTIAPGGGNVTKKPSSKNPPVPPMPPMMSSLICGYSTKAQTLDPSQNHAPVITNKINRSKISAEQRASYMSSSNKILKPIYKVSPYAFARSSSATYNMKSKSPNHHKTSRRYLSEICPPLNKPKVIMTREERDKPRVRPGAFDYASVPNYKSPYPLPHNVGFKDYES